MINIFLVGIGGAFGTVLRYLLGLIPIKGTFPFITFLINVSGAVLIGLIVEMIALKGLPEEVSLLLKTGFCGGFTTFSTFSLETFNLLKDYAYLTATFYIILSVFLSILGVWIGIRLAHLFS